MAERKKRNLPVAEIQVIYRYSGKAKEEGWKPLWWIVWMILFGGGD